MKGPTSPERVRTQPAEAQIIFALLVGRATVFQDASVIYANPRHLESALKKTRGWSAQIPDFHLCNLPKRVHTIWIFGPDLFLVWPRSPYASLGLWLLTCADFPTNISSFLESAVTGNLTSWHFTAQPCVEASSQCHIPGTDQLRPIQAQGMHLHIDICRWTFPMDFGFHIS